MFTRRQIRNLEANGYDTEWISRVMPQGGIKFDERIMTAGDGYYGCIHVRKLPKNPNRFWLAGITNIKDSIVKIDIKTVDKSKVVREIELSMRELMDQQRNGRSSVERMNANMERQELTNFIASINQGGEVLKVMDIVIYVTADTKEELDKKMGEIQKNLKAKDYETSVYIGSQKDEWKGLSQSLGEKQDNTTLGTSGTVSATVIGGGFPFNHQSLIDPRGGYIGNTDTNGAFVFDPFYNDKAIRKSYSTIVLGKSGFGKSTLLKMIADNLNCRKCYIRGFELNRDWRNWVHTNNGKILDLSGTQGMLNPLEPLATYFDEDTKKVHQLNSYQEHRTKFFTLVRFINPDFRNLDIKILNNLFDEFYIDKGLLPCNYQEKQDEINIIGLAPQQYPTVKDFYNYLLHRLELGNLNISNASEQKTIDDFRLVLHDMAISNANIFNGHTTLKNIDSEEILFFDIQSIDGFEPSIKACLLFQAINIVWKQAMTNGLKQKIKLDSGEITEEDIEYFLFIMDECQNILKPEYSFAVDYINRFVREMRKFNAGIYFATQSPGELLPENADNEYAVKIKAIFELCNNRILLRQDESVNDLLRRTFGEKLQESDYSLLNNLEQGQALFNLGGKENYRVNIKPDKSQLEVFSGGQ